MPSLIRSQLLPILLMTGLTSACAHKEQHHDEPPTAAAAPAPNAVVSASPTQAALPTPSFTTEVRFAKKSSTLTKESTGRLSKVLGDALKTGTVDEIDAYVWADQDFSGQMPKKLPPKAHDLAQSRGQMIQAYLENQKPELKGKVKIITMTEPSDALKEKLNLANSRDQNKKIASRASHAAIMILLKK